MELTLAQKEALVEFVEWTANIFKPLGFFRGRYLEVWSLVCLLGCFEVVNLLWRIGIAWWYPDATSTLKRFGGITVICQMMSVFVIVRGVLLCCVMLGMEPSYQYHGINSSGSEFIERINMQIGPTGEAFTGYLLFDLIRLIFYFGDYGKLDMIIHHIGFIVCFSISQYYWYLPLPFSWLVQGELSTLFLNVRWVQKEIKRNTTIADLLFAASFFISRVLLYGIGTCHMWFVIYGSHPSYVLEPHPTMPQWLQHFIVIGLTSLWGLNLVWFRAIVKIAVRKSRGAKKPKTA